MTVLSWVAVLVAGWCAISALAAVGLGALLRRGALVEDEIAGSRRTAPEGALAMWLAELPHGIPDDCRALVDLPAPRRPRDADSGVSEVPTLR